MEKCLHSITFGEKKKSTIVSLSNSSTKFTYIFLWQSLEFLLTTAVAFFFFSPNIEDAVQEWGRAFGTKMPH